MAHDAFISYSSKDKAAADAACALLESRGLRCWIAPRDVQPGSDWSEAIVDAIAASRVMVLVFSSNANQSPQVRREVERAVSKEVAIVPIRIENVLPNKSLEYFISVPHWLDAYLGPLEKYLGRLADRVSALLRSQGEELPSALRPIRRGASGARRGGVPSGRTPASASGVGGGLAWFCLLGGIGLLAAVVGATAFGGHLPWPRAAHAAAAGSAPAGRAATATTPSAQAKQPSQSEAASESGPAPDADRTSALVGDAPPLRLRSIAVVGRERMCVIDGAALREGDLFRGFAVKEIQSNHVIVSRNGTSTLLLLQPKPGAADRPYEDLARAAPADEDGPRAPGATSFGPEAFQPPPPPRNDPMSVSGGPGGGFGGGIGGPSGGGPPPPRPAGPATRR